MTDDRSGEARSDSVIGHRPSVIRPDDITEPVHARPRPLAPLKLTLAFLTIVPVRFADGEATDEALAASRWGYPVVGLGIGLALAGLSALLARVGADPGITAVLLLAASAILTGGLHLDGLADTADGLFLSGDRARRLGVMRDPHVGSFGVVALVLVLLGKYAAISHLGGASRGWALLAAAAIGRTLILVSAGLADYARPEGTGRIVIDATTLRDAAVAALLVPIVGALAAGRLGFLAGLLALALAWTLTRVASERIGGVTGDTLGALVEMVELVVLGAIGLGS